MTKKHTQIQQVIDAIDSNGGYATLGYLYQCVDTSTWATKTPQASIRRIVQQSQDIFKIQPGLWALENRKKEVLSKFNIEGTETLNDLFTHSYYQGLIIEIGKMKEFSTYVPAQDKNKMFLEHKLGEICSFVKIPAFSYDKIIRYAKTVDVIWFNERDMPNAFFEVEHSTDIKNSITKFCDLQDFNSHFWIVAPQYRYTQFEDVMNRTAFKSLVQRIKFSSYENVVQQYEIMCLNQNLPNCI